MRLIDADELRRNLLAANYAPTGGIIRSVDDAPTVDVPQPWTRDGALAEVARIEAAGDTAVVEVLHTFTGKWQELSLAVVRDWWLKPDEPRGNVRVRAVPVETETVPLTQLVGRTIKGETEAVSWAEHRGEGWKWWHHRSVAPRPFPDGTLDLDTGLVTVLEGEA